MRAHTRAMTIRVCHHIRHPHTAVVVYQPQMALRHIVAAAGDLLTVVGADACHAPAAGVADSLIPKITLEVVLQASKPSA